VQLDEAFALRPSERPATIGLKQFQQPSDIGASFSFVYLAHISYSNAGLALPSEASVRAVLWGQRKQDTEMMRLEPAMHACMERFKLGVPPMVRIELHARRGASHGDDRAAIGALARNRGGETYEL
jgi:hypothetical protein